jgi:hypothetical protein
MNDKAKLFSIFFTSTGRCFLEKNYVGFVLKQHTNSDSIYIFVHSYREQVDIIQLQHQYHYPAHFQTGRLNCLPPEKDVGQVDKDQRSTLKL